MAAQTSPPAPDTSFEQRFLEAKVAWRIAHDFDGDGIKDTIEDTFSEGAHCCYRLSIRSSRARRTFRLPFQMDGHYIGGIDLGMPWHFDVVPRNAQGIPMLFMEIETYNDDRYPIPRRWTRRYGIRTHSVCITLPHGKLVVKDCLPPRPRQE